MDIPKFLQPYLSATDPAHSSTRLQLIISCFSCVVILIWMCVIISILAAYQGTQPLISTIINGTAMLVSLLWGASGITKGINDFANKKNGNNGNNGNGKVPDHDDIKTS